MMAGLCPTSVGSPVRAGETAGVGRAARARGQPAPRQRPPDGDAQLAQVVGLADEVVRAGPDRLARRRRIAERREHEHDGVGIARAHLAQQLEAAAPGHAQVGEHRIEGPVAVHPLQCLRAGERAHHRVRLALQHLGEERAGGLVVIDQQQAW